MSSRACASVSFRGSVRSARIFLYLSSDLIVASSAIAITIMSRPSSLWPIVNSFARGEATASASKYRLMSL